MPGPTNRPIAGNSTTVVNETTVQNILNQEIFNNTGYTSIGDVINNLQANGGEIIELGDIGFTDETTVYDFINGSGESWQLEENTMYFFTAESGDYSHLYYWQGDTPLTIGAGGTPVTVDDFDVLLISDNSKPEIPDNSLPKGLAGQAYYIKQGNEVEPDYTLKRGIVTETEAEFTEATTQEVSLAEVFNEWQFFSHSGSKNAALASPPNYPGLDPGGFGGTPLTQALIDKKKAWGYDPINDRIFLTQNFGVYSGFVSPKSYTNYVLEASLSSTSSDDDYLGLVMAFQKDPVTGFEYTISVVRVLNELSGQGDITYAVYYNFFQNGSSAASLAVTTQIALVDGTNLAPIIDGQGNGWVGNHCKLRVERVGDVFTVKTSQFGSYDLDDATLLTINLNDTPELERFKTGGKVGFSALSQANAFFDDVYFTGFNEYILDLQNGYDAPRIFSYDFENTLWAEDPNLTYNDIWGINRFVDDYLFDRVYYLGADKPIRLPGGGNVVKTKLSQFDDDIGATDPTLANTVFVNTVSGDDATGVPQVYGKPFKTELAAFNAVPNDGAQWTIFFIDDDVTRQITSNVGDKNIIYKCLTGGVLDFTITPFPTSKNTQKPYALNIDAPNTDVVFGDKKQAISNSEKPIYINCNIMTLEGIEPDGGNRAFFSSTSDILSVFKINTLNWFQNAYSQMLNCVSSLEVGVLNIENGSYAAGLSEDWHNRSSFIINKLVVTDSATKDLFSGSYCRVFQVGSMEGSGHIRIASDVGLYPLNINLNNTIIDDNLIVTIFSRGDNIILSGNNRSENFNLRMGESSIFNSVRNPHFVNFTGRIQGDSNITQGLTDVILENSNIVVPTYFLKTRGSVVEPDYIKSFLVKGYCSIISEDPINSDMIELQDSDNPLIITNQGTLKTNYKSFGKYVTENVVTASFKEKMNETVIRSKKDIANKKLDVSKSYVSDGKITFLAGEYIYLPPPGENLTINGYGLELSVLEKDVPGEELFIIDPDETYSGGLLMQDIKITTPQSGVFDIDNGPNFDVLEFNVLNFDTCASLGNIQNYIQGLGTTIGFYNLSEGLSFGGTFGGFKFSNCNLRNFSGGTLFKALPGLVFNSDFTCELKANFDAGAVLADFITANFPNSRSFQLLDGQYSLDGSTDEEVNTPLLLPNISPKDDCALFRNRKGIANSYEPFVRVKGEDSKYYELYVDATGNIAKREII